MLPEKQISGLALALTFFFISLLLYLLPEYFVHQRVTALIAGLLLVLGFFGLGTELSSFKVDKEMVNNFFFGIGLFILWYTVYSFWPAWWLLNALLLLVLILGAFGITSGAMRFFLLVLLEPEQLTLDNRAKGLVMFFVALVGFVASALQIMQFIQVLNQ